ncbi:MAG: hypothetical protein JMDDDDMK_04260 [Acidobacteria bacterium]|nr:hypothetical protein [Acidobacteriota bacterium]
MGYDDNGAILKPGGAAHDGRVIAEFTIAMNLAKICENSADEIQRIRTPIVPRELNPLNCPSVVLLGFYQIHNLSSSYYSPTTKSTCHPSPIFAISLFSSGETFILKNCCGLRRTVKPSAVSTSSKTDAAP